MIITKYRVINGLSVAQLAEKVGCSRQWIYMLESKNQKCSKKLATKIAKALRCPRKKIPINDHA